ncbi:MAG TPA: hypothetical protein VGK97_09505 [Spongiibacteraceae bacterium]|jgi:hypothetical protein
MDNFKPIDLFESKIFERELHIKPDHMVSLNFKVSFEFRQAFKLHAISKGLSMRELLIKGFELAMSDKIDAIELDS